MTTKNTRENGEYYVSHVHRGTAHSFTVTLFMSVCFLYHTRDELLRYIMDRNPKIKNKYNHLVSVKRL